MTFSEWKGVNAPYLGSVKKDLSEPLPDQERVLVEDVGKIVAQYSRVGCLLAEANTQLDREINSFYEGAVRSEMTVAEKKAKCDAVVSEAREYRNKIQVLLDSIELRVNFCQSILKQQRGERRMAA